jgi:diguanylate cyclase (GGDEF)-like protein
MGSFSKPFILNSLRQRYLFLAGLMGCAVLGVTWWTGQYVHRSEQANTRNMEQRIHLAVLSHQLRRAVVSAGNMLDLFLLFPQQDARQRFFSHLEDARRYLGELQHRQEAALHPQLPMLRRTGPLLTELEQAANKVMDVRQSANLMYPAMRLANGDMLVVTNDLLAELDYAVEVLQAKAHQRRLPAHERDALRLLYEIRDNWHSLVSAYRLYLINRIGSLYESELTQQIGDVRVLYRAAQRRVTRLSKVVAGKRVELEVEQAIDDLKQKSPQWYKGFQEVVQINTQGNWRGDLPLIQDVIQPLFSKLYRDLDLLDDELKQSADQDLVRQTEVVQSIINALWAMAGFVLFILVSSFLVLETNFIRPVARIARGLKDEARGSGLARLPQVQTREMRDLTEAFRELRDQVNSRQLALEHIAMHDALTSLPNRNLLMQRLNEAINRALDRRRSLALLMLDLDRFKEINDTLGHQTGDALLQQVSTRLRKVLRETDTVARLGGDEFAVVLPDVDEKNAARIAFNIHEELEKVYEVLEHSLFVGVSLGIAVFPQHGENAETLLQHADVAMYMAKRSNSGVSAYDVAKDEHSLSQLSVLSDLRTAVENGDFFVMYQPKHTMADNRLIGVEALVRWRHPDKGIISPDEFIPVAEQTGLIKRISHFVLDAAIRDCAQICEQGYHFGVSVNLSMWDIQDINLQSNIAMLLNKWQLPSSQLVLEVTESVMMAEPERARNVLTELSKMGVSVAVDDFGTGFSSLAYLKQLPVKKLKIDKSFVLDMVEDENDAAIVLSTVELAHNMGIEVVAEGVENRACWERLRALGCDYAQGYYISRPLTREALETYLSTVTEFVRHEP